jgi:hypothetical protein
MHLSSALLVLFGALAHVEGQVNNQIFNQPYTNLGGQCVPGTYQCNGGASFLQCGPTNLYVLQYCGPGTVCRPNPANGAIICDYPGFGQQTGYFPVPTQTGYVPVPTQTGYFPGPPQQQVYPPPPPRVILPQQQFPNYRK